MRLQRALLAASLLPLVPFLAKQHHARPDTLKHFQVLVLYPREGRDTACSLCPTNCKYGSRSWSHKIVDACGCLVHLSTLGLHVCQKPHGFLICSKSLQATEGIWTLDISGHMTLNPLRIEVWHWRSPLDQSAGFSQVMCQLHFYALRESIYLCTFLT